MGRHNLQSAVTSAAENSHHSQAAPLSFSFTFGGAGKDHKVNGRLCPSAYRRFKVDHAEDPNLEYQAGGNPRPSSPSGSVQAQTPCTQFVQRGTTGAVLRKGVSRPSPPQRV